MPIMREPSVPPSAEKITIRPVMALCIFCGKAESVAEAISGYTGAIKRPIKGNTKPIIGISPKLCTGAA